MEKIQAALAKARQERQGASAPRPTARTVTQTNPVTPPDAWAALTPYQPSEAHLQRKRVVSAMSSSSATPFDMMRTKVLQQMRANNWKRLAITSPTPACGKSTTAANLGFSLARQPEIRTVLAELDLRRPSLREILNIQPAYGFADVLSGQVRFDEQALCYNSNLALSVNPGPVRNPAELLQSPSADAAIATIEQEFEPDVMIFDMPPMLGSDDVMAFASKVDCVLLIAAAESSSIKEIDLCEREIASQTNVMGVVLNKCRYMDKEYGYSSYGY